MKIVYSIIAITLITSLLLCCGSLLTLAGDAVSTEPEINFDAITTVDTVNNILNSKYVAASTEKEKYENNEYKNLDTVLTHTYNSDKFANVTDGVKSTTLNVLNSTSTTNCDATVAFTLGWSVPVKKVVIANVIGADSGRIALILNDTLTKEELISKTSHTGTDTSNSETDGFTFYQEITNISNTGDYTITFNEPVYAAAIGIRIRGDYSSKRTSPQVGEIAVYADDNASWKAYPESKSTADGWYEKEASKYNYLKYISEDGKRITVPTDINFEGEKPYFEHAGAVFRTNVFDGDLTTASNETKQFSYYEAGGDNNVGEPFSTAYPLTIILRMDRSRYIDKFFISGYQDYVPHKFKVYISENEKDLFTNTTPVIDFDLINDGEYVVGTSGTEKIQRWLFDLNSAVKGKYIGIKIEKCVSNKGDNRIRLTEIGAFGEDYQDANGDGNVDIADLLYIKKAINNSSDVYAPLADLVRDSTYDRADMQILVDKFLNKTDAETV